MIYFGLPTPRYRWRPLTWNNFCHSRRNFQTLPVGSVLLHCARIKSVVLQLRRAKTDWRGCSQLVVQGALWLGKCYPSTLIHLTGFRCFSYKIATQLSSRGWVGPVPDPILPEKYLGFSRELNTEPLGWQSDVLTTMRNREHCERTVRIDSAISGGACVLACAGVESSESHVFKQVLHKNLILYFSTRTIKV